MAEVLNYILIGFISLLAAISPGPDFFIVLRNNLLYSRKEGFLTSLGISAALLIHITYTLVGIGLIVNESSTVYTTVKFMGAGYLFYIGSKSLLLSFSKASNSSLHYEKRQKGISRFEAFKQGFLTNILNPKVVVFFVSFFSQFISNDTTVLTKVVYGTINWTISLSWFVFLSFLVTTKFFLSRLEPFKIWIDRIIGIALIALSIKIITI